MDHDPWANGWSDPVLLVDKEADISIPSWSTDSEIKWSEPSDIQGSLWSHSTEDDAWATASSTYKGISIVCPEGDNEDIGESLPSPVHSELHENITRSKSPSPSPAHEPLELPPSPDAFGSFETAPDPRKIANIGEDDPWSPSTTAFPPTTDEDGQWGSAWTAPTVDAEAFSQEEISDEWEVAKARKEQMDRRAPPELLASILRQCELLSNELWPEPEANQDNDKDDYTNNWRSDIAGIENLATVVARLVPEDMSLPPAIPFGKTFAAKHMADSVRLSRHFSLTRLSPMSQLVASKGSTAWETSVKSRREVAQDDLPVGWRIVENSTETNVQVDTDAITDKKRNSGLLSFWGRKSTAEPKPERSLSPIRPQLASTPPRSSVEHANPQLIVITATTSSPPPQPVNSEPITSTSTLPSVTSTPTTAPSIAMASTQPDVTQPPPSAVSRFLGRFSRTKSTSTSNQRRSLALSSDDLEFLSDFVPSINGEQDGLNGDDLQLDALSSMIRSSPLPTRLPPPIAPPKEPDVIGQPISWGDAPKPQTPASDLDSLFSLSGSGLAVGPVASSLPPPLLPASTLPTLSPLLPAIKPASPPPVTSTSSAPRPTPVSKSLSSFVLPPPPQTQIPPATRLFSAKPIPLVPRPSSPSRAHTPKPSLVTPMTTSLMSNVFDDDDEFSDFHFSPSKANPQSVMSLYDSSFSPQSSNGPLFSQEPSETSMSLSSSSFDDFDDFVSSPMRSPSPPIPPEKPPSRQAVITPPLPPKPSKASCIERLPASASPLSAASLPEANLFEVDLIGDSSLLAKPPQTVPIASSPAWMPPARPPSLNVARGPMRLSPPPQSAYSPSHSRPLVSVSLGSTQLSAPALGGFNAMPPASISAASKSTTAGKTGGLSAQDLSFFEGL